METEEILTPQQFIWDWAFSHDHKIFVNLDKERYWLVFTYGQPEREKIWNFEHNSLNTVPDYDYKKIKEVLAQAGYKYYAD